ncbi:MAG: hypothetical protein AB8C02_13355 [Halioglobus sp.]
MVTPRIRRCVRAIISALALLPAAAMAGPPPVVVVSGSGISIPTMTQNMSIALGLLLVVVGLRFLKQYGAAQKVLSVLLVGGGLALGALSVERPHASAFGVFDGGDACNGGPQSLNVGNAFAITGFENGCAATDITIVAYNNYPCLAADQVKDDADVGDVISAGDTATLNRCPAVIPD